MLIFFVLPALGMAWENSDNCFKDASTFACKYSHLLQREEQPVKVVVLFKTAEAWLFLFFESSEGTRSTSSLNKLF